MRELRGKRGNCQRRSLEPLILCVEGGNAKYSTKIKEKEPSRTSGKPASRNNSYNYTRKEAHGCSATKNYVFSTPNTRNISLSTTLNAVFSASIGSASEIYWPASNPLARKNCHASLPLAISSSNASRCSKITKRPDFH